MPTQMTVDEPRSGVTQAAQSVPATRQKKVDDLAGFVFKTLHANAHSRITEAQAKERWGNKPNEVLDFWSTQQARRHLQSCVSYLNYGEETMNWPDRMFNQVADAALWTEILTKNGTISKAPRGEWMKAVELALTSIEFGLTQDEGKPDEHVKAGRTAYDYVQSSFGDSALAQKVQALIACSSNKGLHVEKVFTDPSAAEAKVKEFLYGAQPHFFKTTQERRDFAEALLIVKLSDMSRGTHGTDAKSLANDYLAGDRMVQELRRANGLSAQPPKVF